MSNERVERMGIIAKFGITLRKIKTMRICRCAEKLRCFRIGKTMLHWKYEIKQLTRQEKLELIAQK